jgi:pyrrolysine biosynthesis protein PylD
MSSLNNQHKYHLRKPVVTRLRTEDITHIAARLAEYDKELISKTGFSLRAIACHAADVQEYDIKNLLKDVVVGVIPITSGKGAIGGFCSAVKSIVSHIGCQTFIPQATDVAGLAEAFEKKADVIMLADDDRFIAIHTHSRRVVDNAVATGKGFVAGLDLMVGGLKYKEVLVIGCGPVGSSAAQALIRLDSDVSVYDINSACSNDLAKRIKQLLNTEINIVKELDHVLAEHRFIVDATPAADIIRANHVTSDTYISAPGVPLGLGSEAQSKISNRLLHDPLQIGVATMAILALKYHPQNDSK